MKWLIWIGVTVLAAAPVYGILEGQGAPDFERRANATTCHAWADMRGRRG